MSTFACVLAVTLAGVATTAPRAEANHDEYWTDCVHYSDYGIVVIGESCRHCKEHITEDGVTRCTDWHPRDDVVCVFYHVEDYTPGGRPVPFFTGQQLCA